MADFTRVMSWSINQDMARPNHNSTGTSGSGGLAYSYTGPKSWNATFTTQWLGDMESTAIMGATKTFSFYESATANAIWSGSGFLSGLKLSISQDEIAIAEYTVTGSGALTEITSAGTGPISAINGKVAWA
jgi:hypothetical protein